MNLNAFMKEVIETGALSSNKNTNILCDLMNKNVNNIQIQEWLEEITSENNKKEVANLASLMEIHPLGFQKYVIWDQGGIRARLHYWSQENGIEENIHDHRFHFCAKIICGSYTHEVYDVVEPVNEESKVEIKLISQEKLVAGNTYFFSAGVFHRIIPSNEKTISFLVRGDAIIPYTRIIDSKTMKIRKKFGSADTFLGNIKSLIKEL